jgi:DnaJ-class molecular chaperone
LATQAKRDYYEDMGVKPKATQQEIENMYARRAAELRASKVEDAPEELAEVEAAYAVLRDPAKRAAYDVQLRDAEAEEDKKNAELDAYLRRSGRRHRQRNRRTGSWLDVLLDILSFWK